MKKYFLIILSFLFLLPMFANANESNTLPSQVGIVQNVEYIDLDENSLVNVKQIAEIKILTGEFKNKIIELDNMLTGNPYYDIKLKKGNKDFDKLLEDSMEFDPLDVYEDSNYNGERTATFKILPGDQWDIRPNITRV